MKTVTITFEVKDWSADKVEELVQPHIDHHSSMTLGGLDYVYATPISMEVKA